MNYENFVCAVEGMALKYVRLNPNEIIEVHRTDEGLGIVHGYRAEMRKSWISNMLAEARDEFPHSTNILCDRERKIMVVHFKDYWGDGGFGIAKCSPTDSFNEEVGTAVAFAHFRGYSIPYYI